ncbi:hypothetical protein CB1_000839004 [Camelus ferus]|nr:hypothetical protein CB1_000839004 [Camelus ferus]
MVALPQLAQKHLCPGDELAQEGEEASGPSGVCLGPTDLEESNQKHLAPRTQGANLQELHGRRVKPRRGTNTFTSDCGHPTKNGKRPRLCFRKLPLVLAHSSQEDTCQKHGSRQTLPPSSGAPYRGGNQCENQDAPNPKVRGARALCSASNRVRRLRSLPSPLSDNTPTLLPQRGFPPLSLQTFSFQLCLNYSHSIHFE